MRFLIILIAILASCAYGPKTKKKSMLNYLSGDHYQQKSSVLGVPVLQRKSVNTKISGQLLLENEPLPIFLKNITLTLLDFNKKEIHRTKTNIDGTFIFNEALDNGKYFLKVVHSKYKLTQKININSYKISKLTLKVVKK